MTDQRVKLIFFGDFPKNTTYKLVSLPDLQIIHQNKIEQKCDEIILVIPSRIVKNNSSYGLTVTAGEQTFTGKVNLNGLSNHYLIDTKITNTTEDNVFHILSDHVSLIPTGPNRHQETIQYDNNFKQKIMPQDTNDTKFSSLAAQSYNRYEPYRPTKIRKYPTYKRSNIGKNTWSVSETHTFY